MSLEIADLAAIPLYNQDHDGPDAPDTVKQFNGRIRAADALRQLSTAINTLIINRPQVQIMRSWEKFDADGKLIDEQSRQEIRALLEALAAWTRRLRGE